MFNEIDEFLSFTFCEGSLLGSLLRAVAFPVFIDFLFFYENASGKNTFLTTTKTARKVTRQRKISLNVSFIGSFFPREISPRDRREQSWEIYQGWKKFGSSEGWLRERISYCDSHLYVSIYRLLQRFATSTIRPEWATVTEPDKTCYVRRPTREGILLRQRFKHLVLSSNTSTSDSSYPTRVGRPRFKFWVRLELFFY